ncbi:MAG: SRPBCC family protein [Chloroflexota bacterium]|nr:SRPBCC family protein [Chloroflexota bacterium]
MLKRITVKRPADELYAFWHDFRNLPQIMDYLESVEVNGTRSRWKAKAPANISLDWEIEQVEDRPNELIAWRSVKDAKMQAAGLVSFKPAPAEWGTEVTLSLDFDPPGGAIGEAAAKLMGADPKLIAQKALRRFKALLECGEIPTLKHQPAGRNAGRDNDE